MGKLLVQSHRNNYLTSNNRKSSFKKSGGKKNHLCVERWIVPLAPRTSSRRHHPERNHIPTYVCISQKSSKS